jgi:hypothetical protein
MIFSQIAGKRCFLLLGISFPTATGCAPLKNHRFFRALRPVHHGVQDFASRPELPRDYRKKYIRPQGTLKGFFSNLFVSFLQRPFRECGNPGMPF